MFSLRSLALSEKFKILQFKSVSILFYSFVKNNFLNKILFTLKHYIYRAIFRIREQSFQLKKNMAVDRDGQSMIDCGRLQTRLFYTAELFRTRKWSVPKKGSISIRIPAVLKRRDPAISSHIERKRIAWKMAALNFIRHRSMEKPWCVRCVELKVMGAVIARFFICSAAGFLCNL